MTKHQATYEPKSQTQQPEQRSNVAQLDHSTTARIITSTPLPRVRADDLGKALGMVELDTIRDHHLELAMAVIELAADSNHPLPWSHDDPTVALLRAAAKLSLTNPDATSSAAADLITRLQATAPSESRHL